MRRVGLLVEGPTIRVGLGVNKGVLFGTGLVFFLTLGV